MTIPPRLRTSDLAALRWALAVVAALLVVVSGLVLFLFIVQNSAHTAELSLELPYPPVRWQIVNPTTGGAVPVLALMGVSFAGGLVLGLGLLTWQALGSARRIRKLRQELQIRTSVPRAPSPSSRRNEPVTNIATPIRTTANRVNTSPPPAPEDDGEDSSVTVAAGDSDTQTRSW